MKLGFLLLAGERIVPGLAGLDGAERDRVRAIIEHAIAMRPPAVQRQLDAFLTLLRWAPAVRYGRPFDRLPPAEQDAVLRWFQDAPLARVRAGFWGVKTLVSMGYYGRPGMGDTIIDYRLTPDVRRALVRSMRASARIFFASGAARVHAPAGRRFFIEASEQHRIDDLIPLEGFKPARISVSSAHPMGGCRMGSDRAESVTDAWGNVHDVPWLFVADASLFPAAAGINPYLTIMALADRVAERVRAALPGLRH